MQLEDLVSRIRSGDKNAIRELVSAYGNAVYQRAFERTQDKDLAREAARQTFGQFVSIVQQQQDEDGWSLWFGDLIERNIAAYSQIGNDMGYIEDELEREIYGAEPPQTNLPEPEPAVTERRADSAERSYSAERRRVDAAYAEETGRPRRNGGGRNAAAPAHTGELFDGARRKRKSGGGRVASVLLLTVVCALLVWVVAGVAMTMKWIPYYDFGYSWFNQTFFTLF